MDSETLNSDQQTAKEKDRARSRAYYAANRAKVLAYAKEYQRTHKEQRTAYVRAYQAKNSKRLTAISTAYYQAHKAEIVAYNREYRKHNAEKVAKYHAEYNKLHPPSKPKRRLQNRQWYEANRLRINATRNSYRNARRKSDPSYRIIGSLRGRIRKVLNGAKKSNRSIVLIGTTPDKLRLHLESQFLPGMSWTNYGQKGWHIDHVVPCAAFDLSDPKQQARCFHWSNLRPLWAKDNHKKSDTTDGQFQLPLSSIAMEA